MRAYVFWHTAASTVGIHAYESQVQAFHTGLASLPLEGFVTSYAFQLNSVPWLGAQPGYEDWYLISDFGTLDSLERDAVSGAMAKPHENAASGTALGIAGIYKPFTETPQHLAAASAVWFNRPKHVSYPVMMRKLESTGLDVENRLWQRSLTLGPTPEFCILDGGPDPLPYEWQSLMVVRRPLWTGKDVAQS